MLLQRWDPFIELRRMQESMDRVWRGFGVGADGHDVETWSVPLDVVRDGDDIVVRASLPGVNPDDIDVSIEDGVLTVKGQTHAERESKDGSYLMRERRAGSFYRALRLPDSVDTEKAEPHYENGVLSITFPKSEAKKARRLEIKVGGKGKALKGDKS